MWCSILDREPVAGCGVLLLTLNCFILRFRIFPSNLHVRVSFLTLPTIPHGGTSKQPNTLYALSFVLARFITLLSFA